MQLRVSRLNMEGKRTCYKPALEGAIKLIAKASAM
jgi:hypothetical protein